MKRILFFLAVASVNTLSAQISLSESFETTPNAAKGFTIEGFSSSSTPSGCTGKALSKSFYSTASNAKNTIIYNSAGSNGGQLNVAFKYKHPRFGTTAAVNGTLKVEYSVDNGEYQLLDSFDLKTSEQFCQSYTKVIPQDAVPAGKNFNLKITGTYAGGDFYIVVDEMVITQNAPTLGIGATEKNQISIYPNPVINNIYLSDYRNAGQMIITDFSGRTISTVSNPQSSTDVSKLKSGNYIVTVVSKTGTQQSFKISKK